MWDEVEYQAELAGKEKWPKLVLEVLELTSGKPEVIYTWAVYLMESKGYSPDDLLIKLLRLVAGLLVGDKYCKCCGHKLEK